jgi:proliferating cell nuclear antigen
MTAVLFVSTTVQKFINLMSPIEALVDEAKLIVDANGITIKCVDPSHVAMAEMVIKKEAFNDFSFSENTSEKEEFGLKLRGHKKQKDGILDVLNKPELRGSKNRPNILDLKFYFREKIEKSGSSRIVGYIDVSSKVMECLFKRTLEQPDTVGISDPKVPHLNLNTSYEVRGTKLLKQITKFASDISDCIVIKEEFMDDNKVMLVVEFLRDDEKKEQCRIILGSFSSVLKREANGPITRAVYPSDYISNLAESLCRCFGDYHAVLMDFNTDYPIRLACTDDEKSLYYLLAPRIESEK